MRLEQQNINDAPQDSKWRCPDQRVPHERSAFAWFKFVDMLERLEGALGHFVNEQIRTFELDDLHGQPLPHPEMLSFERHRLPQGDHPVGHACDGLFISLRRGFGMKPNVPHQIETCLGGSIDLSFEDYRGHLLELYPDKLGNADPDQAADDLNNKNNN